MKRTRREFIVQSVAVGTALAGLGTRQAQAQDTPRAMSGSNQGMKSLMSMFDLKYPIFQAPTATVVGADVTIAVSSAGALGAIGLTWTPPDMARGMVTKIKAATSRPFAVNYVLALRARVVAGCARGGSSDHPVLVGHAKQATRLRCADGRCAPGRSSYERWKRPTGTRSRRGLPCLSRH